MSINSRGKFSADFKSKVCIDALKERETIEVLCKKYDLHPTQLNLWKKEFLSKASLIFEKDAISTSSTNDALVQTLYANIGELKVANDFLKKSYYEINSRAKANDNK